MRSMTRFKWALTVASGLTAALLLDGCATTSTLVGKRNLDVQTKMSETIFLDPVAPERQTVFVQVRNTSDKQDFNIRDLVISNIRNHGYTIVNDPDQANFLLQANVLQVGKSDKGSADSALRSGFGGPIGSAILGAGTAAAMGVRDANTLGAAGLAVGAADYVGSMLVKDVYYTAITDIQVSQRAKAGRNVHIQGTQDLKQGNSGGEHQTYDDESEWKRYRTRVMSSANQANLEWPDAQGELVGGLSQAIGGLF